MAAKSLALQVGVAPACRALGVPRATFYRRHRSTPGASSPVARPPGPCARTNENASWRRFLAALRRPRAGRGRRDASGRRAVPLLGNARCIGFGCERAGARTTKSAYSPQLHQARAGRDRTERNLVMGYHAPSGAETLDVLLPVRVARHLQPICGRVDGRRTGELGAGRTAHRANLPQARHRAQNADPAFGSRGTDDQQVHRAAAGRPRGDPFAQPSAGQ